MVFAALTLAVNPDPIGLFGESLVCLLVMVFNGKATLVAGVA
jgi:succinate-acetate transporter protein